jgi:hypothetical protein
LLDFALDDKCENLLFAGCNTIAANSSCFYVFVERRRTKAKKVSETSGFQATFDFG